MDRWGHSALVEPLFRAGVGHAELSSHSGGQAILALLAHNFAVMFAVSGRYDEAVSAMTQAIALSKDREEWAVQLQRWKDPQAVAAMQQWEAETRGGTQWVGQTAHTRLSWLGVGCEVQLVWF